MFFELRQYRVKDGQRDRWVKLMEEKIIPFQISKGMVVIGSFVGQKEEDLYVWIRRFASEEERKHSFNEKSPWTRMVIAVGGPGMNIVLPIVLIACLLMTGWPTPTSLIGSVPPDFSKAPCPPTRIAAQCRKLYFPTV